MKKRILIALGAAVVAFMVSFGGVYFALPHLDSVPQDEAVAVRPARTDEPLPLQAEAVSEPPPLLAARDTASRPLVESPPLTAELPALAQESAPAEPAPPVVEPPSTVLEDSVRVLLALIERTNQEKRTVEAELAGLRSRLQADEARKVEAAGLSSTLSRLEDRELQALLQQLDVRVLEILFVESSGRTRTRLLQSMPAERAARFVRNLVAPGSPPQVGGNERAELNANDLNTIK
jgi:hypothetical protein